MDESDFSLSPDICSKLADPDQELNEEFFAMKPIVQVLSVKKTNPNATAATLDRYRIIISDGVKFINAMLATQLNSLVDDGTLGRFVVIQVEKFAINRVQNKRLTIVMEITKLGVTEEKIGNPVLLNVPNSQQPEPAVNEAQPITPAAAPAQQVRQSRSNGGERAAPIFSIVDLSPYNNKFTLKVRVTQKSEIKNWSNNRGEGKLFSAILMDDTGEIKATGFNQTVDALYDKLQEGKVYHITRCRVQLAKKKFSHLQNDYEINLENHTEIQECVNDESVPTVKYNFVKLEKLHDQEKDSVCDVLGVVKEVHELSNIISKATQKSIPKRDLTIVDDSNFSCRLTLWGKQAESFNAHDHPVIAFKSVRVGDYGGRTLSAQSSSTMTLNPDDPDAHALRGWYDSVGLNGQFNTHTTGGLGASPNKSYRELLFANVKDQQLGVSDRTDFFTSKATTMHIKPENLTYPACPSENCNKKVTEVSEGWLCEKCDKRYEDPQHRYLISVACADLSDQMWLQGFNDIGQALFGMSGNELVELRDTDEKRFQRALRKCNGQKFWFECKARTDTYNETARLKYGILKAREVDFQKQCYAELELINSYGPAKTA